VQKDAEFMARGRTRYQKGRVVATEAGGWEIHYNIYLTDPKTGKPKRHHRSRVVGYKPKMRRADAEKILGAELAAINGGPVTRAADGTITFGDWMLNFYIPMRGANWREATRRTNNDYLRTHIYPLLEHVALKDISKFQVQMLLNRLAAEQYSYTVVYHVRDLIKAGLAEAVDQDVLERNVARKTVIPEIEESDKPVLPVEMYAKLLARLDGARDRAVFLIACFCALRPSELFGLTWATYQGKVFMIVNTTWRGRMQRKKIKRKNRFGRTNYRLVAIPAVVAQAIEQWREKCGENSPDLLMFPGTRARGQSALLTPMHPDNWLRLRLYPIAKALGMEFHPSFQVLRRSFSTHGKTEGHLTDMQAQLGHSDPRTTLDVYTRTLGPEVFAMVNQIANRILGLAQEAGPGSVQ
jgi:integrase